MKKERGITLIALVITIIVLLILVAVSIATLTGENGILAKATKARNETDKVTAKDQVQIAVMASYNKDGKLDIDTLKKELEKIEEKESTTDTNGDFPVKVIVDSYPFEIDKDGNITDGTGGGNTTGGGDIPTQPEEDFIMAEDIANSADKSEFYGAIVTGYECANSAGVKAWKIFYVDEKNIYLIADDYIHKDYCPNSKNQSIDSTYNYDLSMNNVIKDYTGSTDITEPQIQNLNKNYFDYLTEENTTSTNANMKAVAYMLDTEVWNVYQGEKAEYAIGGPSIELLFNSYNQKYELDNKYQTRVKSIAGYQISTDKGSNWGTIIKNASDYIKTDDSLYVLEKNENNKLEGLRLASPAYNNIGVMYLGQNGYIDNCDCTNSGGMGFRPIVCLKSNVKLEKQEDGTYVIK